MARVHVLVATLGRADLTRQIVDRLHDQTRRPDGIVVIGVSPDDIRGVDTARGNPQVLLAPKGLCAQRNRGLESVKGKTDILIFFDDDFVAAPDYLEQVERLFEERQDIAGLTGQLIADGIHGAGFSFEQAVEMVEADADAAPLRLAPTTGLYGCNMALRASMAGDLRFDENLPLYGWQEDIDFSRRVGRQGPLLHASNLRGVHMGARGGRISGVRFGYSQIANPFYLTRKGTMPLRMALGLIGRNLTANLRGSLRPEPHIDRRGRVRGNLMALRDIMRGRSSPGRILDIG